MMKQEIISKLKIACVEMRRDCLKMAEAAGSAGAHYGGTLSLIEIIASLYLNIMNFNKDMINDDARDRLILSKGHGIPAVYAAFKQLGILTDEELLTFKNDVTELYGHPSMNRRIGIEFSTGSLGQGLSLGVGVAITLKRKKNFSSRVFVIMGDGECNEGSVWEAALSASKYMLNNLVVIIDRNQLQYDGNTEDVLSLSPFADKWKSFGWDIVCIDGHELEQCCDAFLKQTNRPLAIIADTIKGNGISFMENEASWHHNKMTKSQSEQAWREVTSDRI